MCLHSVHPDLVSVEHRLWNTSPINVYVRVFGEVGHFHVNLGWVVYTRQNGDVCYLVELLMKQNSACMNCLNIVPC